MKFQVNMIQKLSIFLEGGAGGGGVKISGLCAVFTLCILSTYTRTLQLDAQHNRVNK